MNGGDINGIEYVSRQVADPIEKVIAGLVGSGNYVEWAIVVAMVVDRVSVCVVNT